MDGTFESLPMSLEAERGRHHVEEAGVRNPRPVDPSRLVQFL